MSIGMFIEDSRCSLPTFSLYSDSTRGSVSRNIFQYVANGLDVHRGSAPRMASNTYTNLTVPGLSGRWGL